MTCPRRLIRLAGLPLVGVLLGGGIYLRIRGTGRTEGEGCAGSSGGGRVAAANEVFLCDAAIAVKGVQAVRGTLVISVTAAGRAAALREARLLAQFAKHRAAAGAREPARPS